jgi:argininosuccinate lyase
LQETKEPAMKGVWTTAECMRMATKLFAGIKCDKKALKAGLTPEVFATDLALKYVAEGVPFREAYDRVKSELGQGVDASLIQQALASRTHLGSAGNLDLQGCKSKVNKIKAWQRKCCHRIDKSEADLLSLK